VTLDERILYTVCRGYQQMGVFSRDEPDKTLKKKKMTDYDVKFDELEKSCVELLPGAFGKNKPRNIVMKAVNKMKCDANILDHRPSGSKRLPVWRAGKHMVYWQLLLDIDKTVFCLCPNCQTYRAVQFPVTAKKSGKRKSYRDDESSIQLDFSSESTVGDKDSGDEDHEEGEVAEETDNFNATSTSPRKNASSGRDNVHEEGEDASDDDGDKKPPARKSPRKKR
jgi:hypothetical protein